MVAIMFSNAGHATSFSSNKSLPLFNNALKSLPRQEIRGLYVALYVYVARTIAKRRMRSLSLPFGIVKVTTALDLLRRVKKTLQSLIFIFILFHIHIAMFIISFSMLIKIFALYLYYI